MTNWKPHDSYRGHFAHELYNQMYANENTYLLTGDLGYKMFDRHFADFKTRCVNTGAAEFSMVGIACGLAQSGKIPVVYSITPFLIYRPYEIIRNYVNHEKLNVKLVGGGVDKDYKDDGFTHWCEDIAPIMSSLQNIKWYTPEDKMEVSSLVKKVLQEEGPAFLQLRR